MKKPEKIIKEGYDLFDIESYIVEKYNCQKDFEKTWDRMCSNGAHDDSYSYIPTHLNNAFTNAVKEEFGESPSVWISW